MSPDLRVLAGQIAIPEMKTAQDRDAHVNSVAGRIREQLKSGSADLVVLPELSSIAYSRAAFEQLDILAEPVDGATYRVFRELAVEQNLTIVFGIARRSSDAVHISHVAVGPDGEIIGHFDKLHAAQFGFSEEKEFFSPGNHLFTFECGGVQIAPIICYDIRFPELIRTLVVKHGVQLLLHCGAYGRDKSFDSWHAFVTARAIENQIYVLSLNRAGELFGDSVFCGPWVDREHPSVNFPAADEAFKFFDIDLQHLAEMRQKYTFLADRFADYDGMSHHKGS